MQTLISFLRGVNMTGHNSIRMADLSNLYGRLGFGENKTYIQSGNVIFKTETHADRKEIAEKIRQEILKTFRYDIPVIIRDIDELENTELSNPYINFPDFDTSKMAVIFLLNPVTKVGIDKMSAVRYSPDQYCILDREILVYCPNGFGKTKLYTNFFESKMKVVGTARNWKTVATLLEMAKEF